jgi:hypothetical protein
VRSGEGQRRIKIKMPSTRERGEASESERKEISNKHGGKSFNPENVAKEGKRVREREK